MSEDYCDIFIFTVSVFRYSVCSCINPAAGIVIDKCYLCSTGIREGSLLDLIMSQDLFDDADMDVDDPDAMINTPTEFSQVSAGSSHASSQPSASQPTPTSSQATSGAASPAQVCAHCILCDSFYSLNCWY